MLNDVFVMFYFDFVGEWEGGGVEVSFGFVVDEWLFGEVVVVYWY